MKKSTIKKLNQLNKDFYHQTADQFSQSRSYYWSGWKKLLPYVNVITAQKNKLEVLDVGCGNGRFGLFLAEKSPGVKINYFGIDFSRDLLTKAEEKLSSAKINYNLTQKDILRGLDLKSKKFDLIACFGLFHHLPSFNLRQKKLMELANYLNTGGLLVITFWQFGDKTRFKEKIVPPKEVGIDQKELENNDYILDWKRGQRRFRYCHHSNQVELEKMVKNVNLKLIDHFLADGKTNDLNLYLVLKKLT